MKCFEVQYTELLCNKIMQEKTLRTYIKVKTSFIFEFYLRIRNEQYFKSMFKLRISVHRHNIQRGGYNPSRKRICQHYHGNQVEGDSHFLLHCQMYANIICQGKDVGWILGWK